MDFKTLASIDVSKHIEKKAGLSYLSWAWAVDQLLRQDPQANWEFHEPMTFPGGTMMVSVTVTAFGKPVNMHLPVMDHRNKAIPEPDAFAINKAMMRCLVKAIACHGLGLYIYAGEDLPQDGRSDDEIYDEILDVLTRASTQGKAVLRQAYVNAPNHQIRDKVWADKKDELLAVAEQSDEERENG